MRFFELFIVGLPLLSLCSCNSIVGGETDEDLSNPEYMAMATESLVKFRGGSGSDIADNKIRLLKVVTQVVAGLRTVIDFEVTPANGEAYKCHSEIIEQAWLNKKDISVECEEEQQPPVGDETEEEEAPILGILGGEAEEDTSDPKYDALVQESLKKLPAGAGNPESFKYNINRVTEQVVAGLLTKIDFTVFTGNAQEDVYRCQSTILEPAGSDEKDIKVQCTK